MDEAFEKMMARLERGLDAGRSTRLWRALREVDSPEALREFAQAEFSDEAIDWPQDSSRRDFLRLMGASLVMLGAAGCTKSPDAKIIPYVNAPEYLTPGEANYYATAHVVDGLACGVLAKSRAGRPVKLEGNPDHPASLGATSAVTQAALWELYDPQRSRELLAREARELSEGRAENFHTLQPRAWPDFRRTLRAQLSAQRSKDGAGIRVLSAPTSSPTLRAQWREIQRDYPEARWHQWSPINLDAIYAATRRAFGRALFPRYNLQRARVILAVESDFLASGPAALANARGWAQNRAVRAPNPQQNRVYAIESMMTPTGAKADHRLPMHPARMQGFLRALARKLGVKNLAEAAAEDAAGSALHPTEREARWLDALNEELTRRAARAAILVGPTQPAQTHALAYAINAHLGAIGSTVEFISPPHLQPESGAESLRSLARDIRQDKIDLLMILDANPVYDAPADLDFAALLKNVELSVHSGLYLDETARGCSWHVPGLHFLETWSDARAFDGTASIIQPLISPLFGGRSAHDMLGALQDEQRSGFEIVRDHWAQRFDTQDFAQQWRSALITGAVAQTRAAPEAVELAPDFDQIPVGGARQEASNHTSRDTLTAIFKPDPSVHDGRFANNGMLQELPKPLSLLTWDNAAMLSPTTARRLGLKTEDLVRLTLNDRQVDAPVWVAPGHADDCVTLHLGYGRDMPRHIAHQLGFNAYTLRDSRAPWFQAGLKLEKLGETYPLATTQTHHSMHEQPLVAHQTLDDFIKNGPNTPRRSASRAAQSLFPERDYTSYAWAMSIDQTLCTGCNACVSACQAENNVPIVGKEQVQKSREMHWLRIDTYFEGSADEPRAFFQPVMCMHCEKAPCEVVCPVAATSHSSEGINEMTYNRCVGTRYCSNNCPYKVRRFNFLDYQGGANPTNKHIEPAGERGRDLKAVLELKYNPEVTVRSRGVMEKCTYCIQRVNAARAKAQAEGRRVQDGEFQTACEQACPTQAIIFGDKNDPNSRVSKLKTQPHAYLLLESLNTRPRTSYLSAIHHPDPRLEEKP